ncbi:alpha/beta fold hydrolase [Paracoccaceae bacterium Fryx2]|nr:alpha/beta fold hydrolase [Paracoccaceae bacterium Fryx2]
MRRFGRLLGRILVFLLLAFLAIWLLAPDEPVDRVIGFESSTLGDDLDAWLAEQELQFSDIMPETGKRLVWAGSPGVRTPLAVIYVHGFSATWHEIAPVPQQVAAGLGANLFLTRLAGHGRGAAPMAEPVAGDWIEDMAEAMAIGRRLGERVLVIGTSTGGTLAVLAASDPALSQGLAGVVLVSPNFGVAGAAGFLLDLPLVRHWGPLLAGASQTFTPRSPDQAR